MASRNRPRPDIERNILEADIEDDRARAFTVADPITQARERVRGGRATVPGGTGAVGLFTGDMRDLNPAERAAVGWAVRVGFPYGVDYRMSVRDLIVELSVTSGPVTHILEIDAALPFQICIPAELVSARMRFPVEPDMSGMGSEDALPELQWQLERGWCPTTAIRTFNTVPDEVSHAGVPQFATRFCLYAEGGSTARNELAPDVELSFSDNYEGFTVHAYDGDDLAGIMAAGVPVPVPPGGRHWNWNAALSSSFRIAFFYGEVFS